MALPRGKKEENVPRLYCPWTTARDSPHIGDPSALDACQPVEKQEVSVVPEHVEMLTYTQWTVEENKALVEFMLPQQMDVY